MHFVDMRISTLAMFLDTLRRVLPSIDIDRQGTDKLAFTGREPNAGWLVWIVDHGIF